MYAENTSVPVDRSQTEIKRTLSKYKATAFAFVESRDRAMVQFEMLGRRIKFMLPIPIYGKSKDKKGYIMNQKKIDQDIRSRWRSLVLSIKAKLECVESGISTFEEEFMSHIVLPNGHTVGEVMILQIEQSYSTNKMPPLLGMGNN